MSKNRSSARSIILQLEPRYKAKVARMVKNVEYMRLHCYYSEGEVRKLRQVIMRNYQCFVEIVARFVVNCGLFKILLATNHLQFFSLAPGKNLVLYHSPHFSLSLRDLFVDRYIISSVTNRMTYHHQKWCGYGHMLF